MRQSNVVLISQRDALLIEALRGLGWSDDELIRRVKEGDLPIDESKFEFDYEELRDFAVDQPEIFLDAVNHGYQIKYNTIGGINVWITVAFGKEPIVSREPGNESITALLTEAEKERLESVLSYGWKLQKVHHNSEPGEADSQIAAAHYSAVPISYGFIMPESK